MQPPLLMILPPVSSVSEKFTCFPTEWRSFSEKGQLPKKKDDLLFSLFDYQDFPDFKSFQNRSSSKEDEISEKTKYFKKDKKPSCDCKIRPMCRPKAGLASLLKWRQL